MLTCVHREYRTSLGIAVSTHVKFTALFTDYKVWKSRTRTSNLNTSMQWIPQALSSWIQEAHYTLRYLVGFLSKQINWLRLIQPKDIDLLMTGSKKKNTEFLLQKVDGPSGKFCIFFFSAQRGRSLLGLEKMPASFLKVICPPVTCRTVRQAAELPRLEKCSHGTL